MEAEQGLHRYGALVSQLPPSVGNTVGNVQDLVVRIESLQAAVLMAAAPRPEGVAPRRRTPDEVATLLGQSKIHGVPTPLRRRAPPTDPCHVAHQLSHDVPRARHFPCESSVINWSGAVL